MLYVGRLSEEKGVSVLAAAARLTSAAITVVGDGPLSALASSAPATLTFAGAKPRTEARAMMARAAAVVVPSISYENFPIAVAEAFAAGTPVIASRIGALAEIVADGRTGWLATPGDPAALAAAIDAAVADPAESARRGAAARQPIPAATRCKSRSPLSKLSMPKRWPSVTAKRGARLLPPWRRRCMSPEPTIARFRLAGLPIAATNMNGLIAAVRARIAARAEATAGAYVIFRDAHGVVRAQSDATLRAAHEDALIVCADGWPVAAAGRLFGFRDAAQVAGIEALEAVCRAGLDAGWRHYFVGGTPDGLSRLVRNLALRIAGLSIVGWESPPFRAPTAEEQDATRARIRAVRADIVWVGLGTPKQELWMHAEAPHLPGTIAMGVGAAFDVHAGMVTRAPGWVRAVGLEWLYRVFREPRRLFRRYVVTVPGFLFLMLQMGAARLRARGADRHVS